MGKEEKLLERVGRDTGMRVPEGYFEGFMADMMTRLPEYPAQPVAPQLTFWQRVKPYVYMAAMFAGIWCMMKMFHMVSENAASADLDNPPAGVLLAMDDSETFDYFCEADDLSEMTDYEMEEVLASEYSDMQEFEKDFGFNLLPEYRSI
ncbi:MAG: hypothetical protein K2L83_06510 [Muribaculaceae bacterium]|nr:hypothetical protein [Muribaculaceae bacterium]MDE6330347.1 hypothetical protein [Muribaculaceae bacterium]